MKNKLICYNYKTKSVRLKKQIKFAGSPKGVFMTKGGVLRMTESPPMGRVVDLGADSGPQDLRTNSESRKKAPPGEINLILFLAKKMYMTNS